MGLKDDLQEIKGVGPAKADEILTLLDERDTGKEIEACRENVGIAMEYIENGHHEYAQKFLQRAVE